MATSTFEHIATGVDEQGNLPLPWLAPAIAQAQALRRAHALLLHGPAGAGHLDLALTLAQSWLCEQPQQAIACGRCASCRLARGRSHPDLLLLLPDAERARLGWLAEDEGGAAKPDTKPSRDIRVEQMRRAIDWSRQTSGRGFGKVMLLHPADALNLTSANALLKTLEEPPGSLRIVLTCIDPERLLPTVRSRCQRLRLSLPPAAQAADWLQQRGLAEPAPLLALAGGSPLQALAWAAEGLSKDWLADLPRCVAAGDASPLAGRPLPRVIEFLLKLAHDALAMASGSPPRFYPEAAWPAGTQLPALLDWQAALSRAARHDDHPWHAPLLIQSLVMQGAQALRSGLPSGVAPRQPQLNSAP